MEKRDKLSDIRLVGSYGCAASVLAVETVKECCQSLFKCYGVHVRSCLSHVLPVGRQVFPTFSYRPKRYKSKTPVKSGSDNMMFFPLYSATWYACQGGDSVVWFREARLSEPPKVVMGK